MDPERDLHKVLAGREPFEFTALFPGWSHYLHLARELAKPLDFVGHVLDGDYQRRCYEEYKAPPPGPIPKVMRVARAESSISGHAHGGPLDQISQQPAQHAEVADEDKEEEDEAEEGEEEEEEEEGTDEDEAGDVSVGSISISFA
jgi:hypothetical protein